VSKATAWDRRERILGWTVVLLVAIVALADACAQAGPVAISEADTCSRDGGVWRQSAGTCDRSGGGGGGGGGGYWC